jgi:hypothetical protein
VKEYVVVCRANDKRDFVPHAKTYNLPSEYLYKALQSSCGEKNSETTETII